MTKIAIIEDDAVISQMYKMKFELEGFDTYVALDGKDGIKMVEKNHPHLLLLDLQMPDLNGDGVLSQIRQTKWGKNLPVLILTNTSKEDSPEALKSLNVTDYIVKAELTPRQVVNKVKDILNN